MILNELIVSCCANPEKNLSQVLNEYSDIGYSRLECFCDWVQSALDVDDNPQEYLDQAQAHNIEYSSLHLPRFEDDDFAASLRRAIQGAHFAAALGMEVVYPRATSRAAFIRAGKPFLDAIESNGLTAAIEIHKGFPVDNCATLREVLDGICDERMKAVLEVGHLHHAGETWRQAWDQFGERLAVVHLKDIQDGRNVALGMGEIDLSGIVQHLKAAQYSGHWVVELLVPDRENTPQYLTQARQWVQRL